MKECTFKPQVNQPKAHTEPANNAQYKRYQQLYDLQKQKMERVESQKREQSLEISKPKPQASSQVVLPRSKQV